MATIAGMASAAASASALLPSPTAALGKGAKAAREFEAQLIGSVLESLEKTFASVPGGDGMAGEDNYNYMGTQALAQAIAAGGGFGIAKMISEHLETRK
jgi:Rod binding domain-containing protein